jgi:Family of unknown function (DUF6893)
MMKGMGVASTVVLVAAAVVTAVVVVRSLPDVKRYLEMRRM